MRNLMKKTTALVLVLALVFSFAACGKNNATETAPADTQAGGEGKFTPGTYTATATGMKEMTVEVVVSEDEILEINILEHGETPGISDPAIANLPKEIIESQGLGVDAVAGATVTSNAIIEAVTDCLTQAGADIEALKAISAEAEVLEDVDTTVDVVVVGAGGAGLAAAVSANEAGSSVIVLEKMGKVGGNTILSGGALNAVDEGSETALSNEDSVELHYTQTLKGGDNVGDPELVRTMVENAWSGVEWLKGLGMEFLDEPFTVTGGMWPRAHKPVEPVGTGFFKTYMEYIDSHDNIEVMLNSKAEHLIVEDGRVVGVTGTGTSGNKITIRANKGVVLATGGFGANVDLRQEYNTVWPDLSDKIKTTNHPGATGDGIGLGLEANAQLVDMNLIQLLPLGDPETGSLSGNIEQDVEKRIFVNKNGERFVNEGGRRDEMTMALIEQPDNLMYIIVDSHSYPTGDVKNNFNESIDELVAAGRAFKGETLEELAEQIGVPAENLVAAVDDFNSHVEGKEADAFGRTLYSEKLDQGPFYAGPRVPTVHHTMGGLKINTNAQAIDAEGNVIPGLYAAGEVTGGIHGANRLGGNALTDILVFGRIAGQNIANEGAAVAEDVAADDAVAEDAPQEEAPTAA